MWCWGCRPEVLAGPSTAGAAPLERRPLTEPHPFHFISDDRVERRRYKAAPAGDAGAGAGVGPSGEQFKALPLDPSILEAPVSSTQCSEQVTSVLSHKADVRRTTLTDACSAANSPAAVYV